MAKALAHVQCALLPRLVATGDRRRFLGNKTIVRTIEGFTDVVRIQLRLAADCQYVC